MAHPNEDLLRKGYDAFAKGDLETIRGLMADNIVLHVPGRAPLSGDYKGKDQALGWLARVMQESEGTYQFEVHDMLANDEHGIVLTKERAQRGGKSYSGNLVTVHHLKGGKFTESWFHPEDLYAADEFWS